MSLLHITETVKGGVGHYLDDLVQAQAADSRWSPVRLAAPADQQGHFSPATQPRLVALPAGKRGLLQLLRLWWAIARLLHRTRPQVLFLHSSFAGLLGRCQPRLYGARVIYVPHGWSFQMAEGRGDQRKARIYAGIERLLARRCDAIVCVAEAEVADARRLGLPAEKLLPIITGLKDRPRSAPTEPDPAPPVADQPLRVCFIGRLCAQKGVATLERTLLLIQQSAAASRIHFDIIGDSEDDPGMLARWSAWPQVTCHGWLPRARCLDLLDQADLLFLPSAWEGLPLTALEALRAGKPLLTSRIAVLQQLVAQTGAGATADAAEDFARLLTETPRAQWQRWGAAARQAFDAHYRFEDMLLKMDRLLARLLAQRQPGERQAKQHAQPSR